MTRRPFHAVLASLFVLTLLAEWNPLFASNPPHPRVRQMIAEKKIPVPYYLQNREELLRRGVNAPWVAQGLRETRMQRLGEPVRSVGPSRSPSGSWKAIALLVDFSDKVQSVSASFFDNLLFGTSVGSMRDYFGDVSYGNLDIVTVHLPGSVGWISAPQTYAYYVNGANGFGTYPQNAQKLVEDVVAAADSVVDFSQYDNDGDGYVDALFVIHSGPGAEFTGSNYDIWSHAWVTSSPRFVDGVSVYRYSMEPEYWQSPGDMTCGVYAHELGHSGFGLPDLYDTDYSSRGLGTWSLMAGGSWTGPTGLGESPAFPDAWSHFQMGFVNPLVVTNDLINESIPGIETAPVVYRLWTNGEIGNQYFLVQNRRKIGYDSYLPAEGLLIYHVDESVTSGNRNEWYPGHTSSGHYLVALEQADGLYELEKGMSSGNAGDPFPGSTNAASLTDVTIPDSRTYEGIDSKVRITNISGSALTMTADLSVNGFVVAIDPYEPNNDHTQAYPIYYGQRLTEGIVDPPDEFDYFMFAGVAGDTLIADVDAASLGSTLDAELTLFDTNGVTELAFNNDWDGLDPRIQFVLPAGGTYYLMITDSAMTGGLNSTYELELTLVGNPNPPILTVVPDSFTVNLGEGDSVTHIMTIGNEGSGMLTFSVNAGATSPAVGSDTHRRGDFSNLSNVQNERRSGPFSVSTEPSYEVSLRKDFVAGNPIVAVSYAGFYPNEYYQLVSTLSSLGYSVQNVSTIGEVLASEAEILIIRYAATINAFNFSDLDAWVRSGKGLIQLGDWEDYFPNSFYAIYEGSALSVSVQNTASPLTEGLPPEWSSYGFWRYDYRIGDYIGYVTDSSFPNVISAGGYDRVVTSAEVGDGRAVFIGFNVYGSDAGVHDVRLFANALNWVGSGSSWISVNPTSGAVSPGSTQDVEVTFNAGSLAPGDYRSSIAVTSNDLSNSPKIIPASLRVEFIPKVSLRGMAIDDDENGQSYGNNDSTASPGEFLEVYLSVENVSGNSLTGVYAVPDRNYDPYVSPIPAYFFDSAISALNDLLPGIETVFVDDFDFYVSADAPDGHLLTIPLTFYVDGSIIGFDTLRIPLTGIDVRPPRFLSTQVSPGYTPLGGTVMATTFVQEAGTITSVVAQVESPDENVVSLVTLHDDGSNGDAFAGDRTFTGLYTPLSESDYVVDLQAADGGGNSAFVNNAAAFTSRSFIKENDLLLVADDRFWTGYQSVFRQALEANGYQYDVWQTEMRGPIDSTILNQYLADVVIWYMGWTFPTLSPAERDVVAQFLDKHGRLFITEQDLGFDLHVTLGADSVWYRRYLHARYIQDDIDRFAVQGVANDPISDGLYIPIQDVYFGGFYPDEIDPLADAIPVFTYDPAALPSASFRGVRQRRSGYDDQDQNSHKSRSQNSDGNMGRSATSSGTAALRVNNGRHKLVYFAFGFEAIVDSVQRRELMRNVVEWLRTSPVITVAPDSFDVVLTEGDTTSRILTIGNIGNSDLVFSLQALSTTGPEAIGSADSDNRTADRASAIYDHPRKAFTIPEGRYSQTIVQGPRNVVTQGRVLVIGDGGTETDIVPLLAGAGYEVTVVSNDAGYDGTNPSPNSFQTVILLDGVTYGEDMPFSGQTALVTYVQNGGGLLFTEWIAWEYLNGRYQGFGSLIPVPRSNGRTGTETYSVMRSHPITYGLPSLFSVTSGSNIGTAVAGTVLVNGSESGDAVVVQQIGDGRVVQFAMAGNYDGFRPFLESAVHTLLLNTVGWLAGGYSASWLAFDSSDGIILPSGSLEVGVHFDATGLQFGKYAANILINSNDVQNSHKVVPARLTVNIGNRPAIVVTESELNSTVIGDESQTLSFFIKNIGFQPLDFAISDTSFMLMMKRRLNNDGVSVSPSEKKAVPVLIKPGQLQIKPAGDARRATLGAITSGKSGLGGSGDALVRTSTMPEKSGGLDWLTEVPASGSVAPGDSIEIEVTFDATGLSAGVYEGQIQIASNDPFKAFVIVNATLTKHLVNFTTADNENNFLAGIPDYDMDVYLYNTDPRSPIEFNILVGEESVETAELNLLALDIDWAAGERDSVVFNGHFAGYLTGADGQWSTSVLPLDPGWVVPGPSGKNLVQVFIDVGNVENWAVELDWGQLVLNGAQGLAQIRYVTLNQSTYVFGDTLLATIEVDSDSGGMLVDVETDIVDPLGNIVLGTSRTLTVTPGNEPFSEVFVLSPDLPAGAYEVRILVFDAATHLQQDMLTTEFELALPSPVNVFAGNGFNGMVPLTWDLQYDPWAAPGLARSALNPLSNRGMANGPRRTLAVQYYNVYRSSSPGGPYTLIAPVTTAGRGYFDNGDFIDFGVTNGQTYYYVVTVVYENGESGPSDEVSATPMTAGHVVNSVYALTVPSIDGVITGAEWDDAEAVTMTMPGVPEPVIARMKNSDGVLYIAVEDFNNTSGADWNEVGVYFDSDHNRMWDPDTLTNEGNFWIDFVNDTTLTRYRGIFGNYPTIAFKPWIANPEGLVARSSFSGGHVHYEFSIDLQSPYFNEVSDTLGLWLFSYDDSTLANSYYYLFDGIWPLGGVWTAPETYGSVVLSSLIDVVDDEKALPRTFTLNQNYPNPFNPVTTIRYELPKQTRVIVKVYNVVGEEVATLVDQEQAPGYYTVQWNGLAGDGTRVSSGVYFYRISAGEFRKTLKMIMVK